MKYNYDIGETVGFYIDDKSFNLVYGKVLNRWTLRNGEKNYIIDDVSHIQHERSETELQKIDNIDEFIGKSYCDISMQELIEKISDIDKRFTLTIKSEKILYSHIVSICFGLENNPAYINDNGEFSFPGDIGFTKENNYKCSSFFVNADIKQELYKLYANIYLRKTRSNKNE